MKYMYIIYTYKSLHLSKISWQGLALIFNKNTYNHWRKTTEVFTELHVPVKDPGTTVLLCVYNFRSLCKTQI